MTRLTFETPLAEFARPPLDGSGISFQNCNPYLPTNLTVNLDQLVGAGGKAIEINKVIRYTLSETY